MNCGGVGGEGGGDGGLSSFRVCVNGVGLGFTQGLSE